jgi:hypothetical protein
VQRARDREKKRFIRASGVIVSRRPFLSKIYRQNPVQ